MLHLLQCFQQVYDKATLLKVCTKMLTGWQIDDADRYLYKKPAADFMYA
jgi:hypothetical protein